MLISLARTILKSTLPGVPDFYQGTAVWDFSLVDPDNRRPVDYSWPVVLSGSGRPVEALLDGWHDGAIKLFVIAKLLADRRALPDFYAKAGYDSIEASGADASRVLCFTRSFDSEKLAVAVPRLLGRNLNPAGLPLGEAAWGETSLGLPDGVWQDILCDRRIEISGAVPLAKLFDVIPFSVLRRVG